MFKMRGILTYLKGEMRLVLSNDNHVHIRETTANYTITLYTDTFVYAVTGKNDKVEMRGGKVGNTKI
eukprot:1480076-Pleurochrysis_carterae.AAC.2